MSNVWYLLKVQLLAFFNINRAIYTKDRSEKRKFILFVILVIFFVIYFGGLSFGYSMLLSAGLKALGRPDLLLAMMMAVTSVVVLFTSIFKSSGILFNFKDYNMVMSLPVKTSHIVASRILLLYVMNIFFSFIFIIPAGVVYAMTSPIDPIFYMGYVLTLLFVPLVPIVIASIIGSIIGYIASFFKRFNVLNIIFQFILILGIIALSFSAGNMSENITEISSMMAEQIYNLYPLAKMYTDGVCNGNILSLILFIVISIAVFGIFTILVSLVFKKFNTILNTSKAKSHFKMTELKEKTQIGALLSKESKRYFSSAIYVLNTGIGVILMLIMAVASLFFNLDSMGEMMGYPGFPTILARYAPIVLCFFIVMSCTTSSSISLEGRNLWIIKSSPVREMDVLKSKIYLNLTILIPAIIITSGLLSIALKPDWKTVIIMFLLPCIYAVFISLAGILINLKFPNFDWTNEVTVIKQSVSATITIFLGFASLILPIVAVILPINIQSSVMLAIVALIMIVIDFLLYKLIKTKGVKMYNAL